MRKGLIVYWVGGAAVVILSFAATLWLTEPEVPAADRIQSFKASAISDEATLNQAARAADLKNSPYVRGSIDGVKRTDDGSVTIVGWATETITLISKGAPVTVMVFSEGQNLLNMQAQGERPDVTSVLNLSAEAAKNVSFSGRLACKAGAKLVVVAVSVSGTYAGLGTRSCP